MQRISRPRGSNRTREGKCSGGSSRPCPGFQCPKTACIRCQRARAQPATVGGPEPDTPMGYPAGTMIRPRIDHGPPCTVADAQRRLDIPDPAATTGPVELKPWPDLRVHTLRPQFRAPGASGLQTAIDPDLTRRTRHSPSDHDRRIGKTPGQRHDHDMRRARDSNPRGRIGYRPAVFKRAGNRALNCGDAAGGSGFSAYSPRVVDAHCRRPDGVAGAHVASSGPSPVGLGVLVGQGCRHAVA